MPCMQGFMTPLNQILKLEEAIKSNGGHVGLALATRMWYAKRSKTSYPCWYNVRCHNPLLGAATLEMLRWCAQCMVTRGLVDPWRSDLSQHLLNKDLSNYLKLCTKADQRHVPNKCCRALPSFGLPTILERHPTLGCAPSTISSS